MWWFPQPWRLRTAAWVVAGGWRLTVGGSVGGGRLRAVGSGSGGGADGPRRWSVGLERGRRLRVGC